MEVWDPITKRKVSSLLRKAIISSIAHKKEFKYIKGLAERNKYNFNEEMIDSVLDRYIELRRNGEEQFQAKYRSMYRTGWKILME